MTDGLPRRHVLIVHDGLNRLRSILHIFVSDQFERPRLPFAVTHRALRVNNGRDMFGEGHGFLF